MRLSNAALFALVLCGCNGERKAYPPSGHPGPLAGRLPRSVKEVSAAELESVVGTVKWIGGHSVRRCSTMFLCGFGASKVDVYIEANEEARLADYVNVGKEGTALIRVTNQGEKTTGMFNIKPHPFVYIVTVYSTGPDSAKWYLLETFPGQTGQPPVADSGSFKGCHKQNHPVPAVSYATFQRCSTKPNTAMERASVLSFSAIEELLSGFVSTLAFDSSLESPGWISCAYGCCTMTY